MVGWDFYLEGMMSDGEFLLFCFLVALALVVPPEYDLAILLKEWLEKWKGRRK